MRRQGQWIKGFYCSSRRSQASGNGIVGSSNTNGWGWHRCGMGLWCTMRLMSVQWPEAQRYLALYNEASMVRFLG